MLERYVTRSLPGQDDRVPPNVPPQWKEEDRALPRGATGSRGIPGEWSQELLTKEPGRSHAHTEHVCAGMDTCEDIHTDLQTSYIPRPNSPPTRKTLTHTHNPYTQQPTCSL